MRVIEFGKHVKRRRLALKYTQAHVARSVGMSRPWLVDLEQGKGNPKAETISALAVALAEDPRDYLKLAGRVALTAEDLIPARAGELPPEMAGAVERAVARALDPLVARIDRMLSLLEQHPSAG